MNRIHVLIASLIVGLAAIFGLAATTKTVGIGQAKPAVNRVSDRVIATREVLEKRLADIAAQYREAETLPLPPPIELTRSSVDDQRVI